MTFALAKLRTSLWIHPAALFGRAVDRRGKPGQGITFSRSLWKTFGDFLVASLALDLRLQTFCHGPIVFHEVRVK